MHVALLGRQRVEARGDEAADRRRQAVRLASLPRSLITAASCSMKSGLPSATSGDLGRLRVGAEEVERELRGVRAAERLERKRVVGEQSAAPRGPRVEQLRPRERQEQDGKVVEARGEELDQVEQRRVGPVDVLEHERRRPRPARRPR